MPSPNPGKNQVSSNNTRKTWNALSPQTHSIQNGLPVSIPRVSGPTRSLSNMQARLDSIQRAINSKRG